MIQLILPRLSLAMEEAKILSWLAADGDAVRAGQPVAEIETDKATLEIESPADGVLHIMAPAGTIVSVEESLAEIATLTENETDAAEKPIEMEGHDAGGEATAEVDVERRGRVISPAARRLAHKHGIDVESLAGSGPDGRILAVDVEEAAANERPTRDLAGLRSTVRANIVASWSSIPHVHIAGELEADGLAEALSAARTGESAKTTVTDLLVLAVAGALRDVPELNGVVGSDGAVELAPYVNLGLAVATENGVIAPVIRDAAALKLADVANERRSLVAAARAGSLDPRRLGGATCTLSNLGMHPVDFFAPVISGPQIALVAVGRLAEKPVAVGGVLGLGARITVNVALDHRAADGEVGGRFLASLEDRLVSLPRAVVATTQEGEPHP
jgi:pyruvate dehydrogenase E2 component (dihydrolipoamide acetyltransferase)